MTKTSQKTFRLAPWELALLKVVARKSGYTSASEFLRGIVVKLAEKLGINVERFRSDHE